MDGHIAPRHDGAAARERPARRQVTVDATLLETAMRLTGRGQSDTIDEALRLFPGRRAVITVEMRP